MVDVIHAQFARTDASQNQKPEIHTQAVGIDGDEIVLEATAANVIPKRYRYIALLCVIALPLGSNWTQSSVGPLKNTLRNEWNITNAQFGVISSADAFVNTVFPILGGLVMDWWGPNMVTLACTIVIFGGSLIAAAATVANAWRLLVGGHVLMGFGIAVLDSAQQKFFYHWFGSSGLAFAFGIENAFANVTGLVAGMTAIPIRDSTGWFGWSFWIPSMLCAFSLLINIAYVCFERFFVPQSYQLTSERGIALAAINRGDQKRKFTWNKLLNLPWCYLMLPATQLLQSGAAGGFGASATDLISMKGYEEAVAGYLSTAQKILPIVLSPAVGWLVDVYGHRFHLVALAPLLWITANSLIGFTNVHPLVALVFSSLAGVINAMPLQICIPLLVADQAKLGTAFGVWRAFNNSGSTIMDVVFGALQDSTVDMGYDKVLKLSTGLKAWAFVLGIIYIVVDYKALGKGMTMTRYQRVCVERNIVTCGIDPADHALTRREPKRWVTIVTACLLVAMIASAWAVFIRYLA